jgi:hypothetical protein
MAFLRPELSLARLVSRARLGVLVQAAINLVDESYPCTADRKEVARERKLLQKAMSERARAALKTVVRHYLAVAGPDDLSRWLEGAELSAARAALLAAGEVGAFKRVVLDARMLAEMDERAVRRRLTVFLVGGDLHTLRVALGITAARKEK